MWQTVDDKLYKKFELTDFREAIAFINQVAAIAEQANHHPTIQNNWNTVELWLTTHDEGNKVTVKDKDLATKIDMIIGTGQTVEAVMAPKKIKLYADGGSRGNPGPSASGYVLLDMNDKVIKKSGVYLGITTNNQAEYLALKYGLEEAHKLGVEEVDVFMDSLLVINQMKGAFKVKNRELLPINQVIKDLASKFKSITYTHVPRELNKLADAEVNTMLDAEEKK